MKQTKLIYTAIFTLAFMVTSCNKYDDNELWDAVNSLDDRVTHIEQRLEVMNKDITTIRDLADALEKRLYITEVKELGNGYCIIFSDGSRSTITNGKDGIDGKDGADAPVINVKYHNGKYYWVQTIDEQTTWLYDNDGNMIPASGLDAITPLLKVDSDGYWIISYDNGYTYSKVLDSNGMGVKAAGSDGDSFFDSVEATENKLIIVLTDGTEIVIPLGEQSPYKAVNLGLSVKWASFNMGATTSTEQGDLYLWGDNTGNGIIGYYEAPKLNNICGTNYDIARGKWGGKWRLPSKAEQEELVLQCSWKRTTINGVTGMKVTGKNGNSIFLPPTGYALPTDGPIGQTIRSNTNDGYYWVGESYNSGYGWMGYVFYFNSSSYYYNGSWNTNYVKMAVRPVKE